MTNSLRIYHFDEVGSTNDLVKEAAIKGEPEGYAAVAKTQTSGYGQRGHKWDSPYGGIYFSILLCPDKTSEEIKELGQVAAVGIMCALKNILEKDSLQKLMFKWPNDIIVPTDEHGEQYRKLCGISTELKDGKLCLGVGVNAQCSNPKASDGRNNPISLEELGTKIIEADIYLTAEAIAQSIWQAYQDWLAIGFDACHQEYHERLRPKDQPLFDRYINKIL